MSISFNNFSVSAGLEFFTKQTEKFADKLLGFTFTILDGATTGLGRLLPDLRPSSVGEVFTQAKKSGSALFTTHSKDDILRGNVLIEITKDDEGRYLFRATDQSFEPVIYHQGEGENSLQVWEAKVTEYLSKTISVSESVSYGDIGSRWRGDKFNALKAQFIAEGHLRDTDKGIVLYLPEEEPLTFDNPLKAESVLKYFYQDRRTPLEEEQSRTWDLLSKLFTGYLYFSGHLLAPWIQDNVMLPHQKAAMDYARANQITADGYLSSQELAEMAKNETLRNHVLDIAESLADQGDSHLQHQLGNISFQSNGYTQFYQYEGNRVNESFQFSSGSEIHTRTVSSPQGNSTKYITEQNKENLIVTQKTIHDQKTEVQKATFTREGTEWKLVNEEKYNILSLPGTAATSTL